MKIASIDHTSRGLTTTSTYLDAVWCIRYMFDTEKELNTFLGLFPKYCKVIAESCTDYYKFGAKVDLSSPTSKVTGDINETADKRVKKIKSILKTILTA